jgi:epoxyqueuosine reductase
VSAAAEIKRLALEAGFDDCRIAAAAEAPHARAFREWIADGCHGEMAWMERTPERRCDPREVLPGCKSVVCLALNYYPGRSAGNGYRIARYAWNDDYHDIVEKMLKRMDEGMAALGGTQRYYVDTGPVLERDHATAAGLGWNGKSTVQIHRQLGTWTFLAELLTTLELPADPPFGDHCGKCTRCLDACPTQAITAPHRVDARRCISYLTIEHKGPIPEEFREAIGDRLYGCDECLEVCPWNRFAQVSRESRFHAREAVFALTPRDFLTLDDEGFRSLFAKSPIKRIKRARFLRNVCVVLGNTGTEDDLPALRQAAAETDPLIAEHAAWAVARIRERTERNRGPAGAGEEDGQAPR